MTSLNNDYVINAWKALSGSCEDEGWRSIPVSKMENCTILAARKFPGNEEAILLGFSTTKIQPSSLLPQSKGFKIEQPAFKKDLDTERQWLALVRQPQGNLGLFSQMAADIINTISSDPSQSSDKLYQYFILRVKAWQEFMKRSQAILSPAEELGLMGELEVIKLLLKEDLPASLVIESWVGPIDGIQDFYIGSGALEVKSTLSKEGFSAQILSLNQLDDSVVSPIYLCGAFFSLDPNGQSLPEIVEFIRDLLSIDPTTQELFNNILLRAGYFDSHAKEYSRSFVCETIQIWWVNESFPRLVPSNVPLNVRQVRYEIDLSGLEGNLVTVQQVLNSVEVL